MEMPRARFVALPVKGDAFYLRRGRTEILFDGGGTNRGKSSVPDGLLDHLSKGKLDVAVCSHNDSDHAKGIIAVVREGITKQLWLPANWLHRLPSVLNEPYDFMYELADEVALRVRRGGDVSPTQVLRRAFREVETDGQKVRTEEISLEGLKREAAARSEYLCDHQECGCWKRLERRLASWVSAKGAVTRDQSMDISSFLVDSFKNIRILVTTAFARSIKIRWFEHKSGTSGDGEKYLCSVNSEEITKQFQVRRYSPLVYLSLTAANIESLVFRSPSGHSANLSKKTELGPDVLFCADSPLASKPNLPIGEKVLITAPHHGSVHNESAYNHINDVLTRKNIASATWIRGNGNVDLGDWYLQIEDRKMCVKCSDYAEGKEGWFTASRHHWRKGHGREICSCKGSS
jgi:hypothetical protein